MTALGLTRGGRTVVTIVAVLGGALAVADDAIPRHGSEADLEPNIAAAVLAATVALLVFVALADAAFRGARWAARAVANRRS